MDYFCKSQTNSNNMKRIFISFIFSIIALSLYCQVTPIWSMNCGGSNAETFYGGCYGKEGRYAFIGQSASSDHDLTVNYGNYDAWLYVKNADGSTFISNSFNGTQDDYGIDIVQRSDSMYVFLINTASAGSSDFPSNFGNYDFWIKSMTTGGIFSSGVHLGGAGNDYANDLALTLDGGYLVAGTTYSTDTIFSGNQGFSDGFVIRISPTGNLVWAKTYGGASYDNIQKVTCLPDGTFMAAGYTGLEGAHNLNFYKISSTGNLMDAHTYIGDSSIYPLALVHINNDTLFAGGYTNSTEMNFSENSDTDAGFIMRFKGNTDPDTMAFVTGTGMESVTDIIRYNDSLLLVTIVSTSNSGIFAGNQGNSDVYVALMDYNLNIKSIVPFGGSLMDGLFEFFQTASFLNPSNQMVIASCSQSSDHDLPGNYGVVDGWILRFDPALLPAGMSETSVDNISIYPNPTSDAIHVILPDINECSIDLLSLDGSIVNSWNNCGNINRLDIEEFNSGIYLLHIQHASGSIVKRIVIQ